MDIIMECKNVDYSYPLYRLKEESFTESLVKMDQVRRHYVLYCEDLLQVFIKGK